jgi:hypothetical protein
MLLIKGMCSGQVNLTTVQEVVRSLSLSHSQVLTTSIVISPIVDNSQMLPPREPLAIMLTALTAPASTRPLSILLFIFKQRGLF